MKTMAFKGKGTTLKRATTMPRRKKRSIIEKNSNNDVKRKKKSSVKNSNTTDTKMKRSNNVEQYKQRN
jgi:hypothetical protein